MKEKQIDLARRAVACKGFRWMPGMLDVHGGRVVSVEGGLLRLDYQDDDDPIRTSSSACLPDLTDPATLGCLLALVREAWGLPLLSVAFDHDADEWIVRSWNATILWQGLGNTEAVALTVALEAAPEVKV
jgi:hypothetical protein